MLNSDNILGFLCAVVAHIIGFLLVGGSVLLKDVEETPPTLDIVSLELSLVDEDIPSEQPATGPVVSAQETPQPEPEPEPEPEPVPPEPDPEPEPEPPPVLQPEPEPVIIPEPLPEPEPQPEDPPPVKIEEPVPEPEPEPPPPTPPAPTPPTPVEPAAVPEEGATQTAPLPGPAAPGDGGTTAQGRVTAPTTGDLPIKPRYPIGSRRRGEEGSVIFDVLVSKEGRAKTVTRVESSGFPELDNSAESAVSKARFTAGTRDGKPVEATARLTIIFRLNER